MKYLIDTNICVYFLRGKFNLDSIFKKTGLSNLYISEITAFELSYGAELSDNKEKSQNQVKKIPFEYFYSPNIQHIRFICL